MQNYSITSYVGVGPLKFGMKRTDIHNLLGAPLRTRKSRFSSELTDFWNKNGLQLTFLEADGELVEIGLYPNLPNVDLNGIKLFDEPGNVVMKALRNLDNSPLEKVGVTIFLKLGIAATGFLNEDGDQKSVSVFIRGRWNN